MGKPYVTQAFIRRDLTGEHFACMATKKGFKCGICKRGNLGFNLYRGQRCLCCHAQVSQVILSNQVTFPISLSQPGRESRDG